jgi:hypothetical protein
MKMIKQYWALIVGGILALLGLTAYFGKKISKKKTDKLDTAIDQNNKQVDINAGKIDVIEDIKQDILEDVIDLKTEIDSLQKQKAKPTTTKKPKTAKAAKDNILSKTNKKKPVKKK